MKIVQINTNDIRGGASRAAYRLHRGLLQSGEDCRMLVKRKDSTDSSVFCVTPKNSAEEFEEEFFLSTVIQGHYINSHRTDISNTIFSLPYPGYDLSALPLVQGADVINLHWVVYYQSLSTLHKLFALGKPVVWTLHDQWAFTGGCHYAAGCEKYRQDCVSCPQLADDPFDLPAAVLKDKLELFKGANLTIVTPSRWLAVCARQSRLLKDLWVEVIPNSLETDVFSPLPKAEAKESVGLAAEIVTLLFAAHVGNERRKGFRELIAAIQFCLNNTDFQHLVKSDKVRLLCLGQPSGELEAVGIPVISLGYLNSDKEIRAAYAAADIFILPSLEDNLPNTMLESMSCGTPVVAFDVGGMPDVIVSGVTGQLAPAGDVRKLGEAILSLVFDPDQREVMGRNCRKMMVEGYSLPVQAQRYLELYQELCREHKLSTQITPEDSTAELEQPKAPIAASTANALPVYLDIGVGPHFQDISGQVLFKALKEFAPAREKAYQAADEQLKQQGEQLKLQTEQLQRQEARLQRQEEWLQRQEERLQRQEERLQRLAAQNRNLNLELSQLRGSWSWKMTAPLRKVDNVLRSFEREKMRMKKNRERGSAIRVIKNGKKAVSKVKNVIQPVSKRQKKSYHYALIEDLKRHTRIPKERVLVVGCNKGLECDLFRQNGAEDIVGLDIIEGIGKDYPHPRTQYIRGSAEDMPFEDGTFDLVASFATLEHIPNPKAALEEMIRVTARNGVIYCQAAPLWNSPFGHHRKNFFPDDPWIHIRTKSPEEMKTFYAEYCNPNVGGVSIYAYIDYLYTQAFNRVSTREYKAILAGLLDKISPIAVRFNMNLEHRQLYTEEILEELKDYTEEELLTEGLTVVLRKV